MLIYYVIKYYKIAAYVIMTYGYNRSSSPMLAEPDTQNGQWGECCMERAQRQRSLRRFSHYNMGFSWTP